MRLSLIFLCLLACSPAKDAEEKAAPDPAIISRYDSASDRALSMTDRGFVVSRWEDGSTEHQGDALIWTGILLAHLPCDKGQPLEDALLKMVDDLGGGFYRHPSLSNSISLDGIVGAYRGISHRIVACPGSATKWAPRLQQHLALDRFNPASAQRWEFEFRYVPELALAVATGGPRPDSRRLADLAKTLESWAAGVQISHSACFRVNVAYQTIRTVEELGGAFPALRRDNFCGATRGMRLATVDAWCGRGDLPAWIATFRYDEWEYAHQRCPWEDSPDGKPGLHTPAVDLIEAYDEAYRLVP